MSGLPQDSTIAGLDTQVPIEAEPVRHTVCAATALARRSRPKRSARAPSSALTLHLGAPRLTPGDRRAGAS